MNFQGDFPGLPGSVAYFWYIAVSAQALWATEGRELMTSSLQVPVAVSTILIFGWTYLRDLAMRMRRSALRLYHRTVSDARGRSDSAADASPSTQTVEKQTKEE